MISAFFAPNRVKTTIGGITAILTTIGSIANTLSTVDPVTHQRGKPDFVTAAAGIGGGLMLVFAYDRPRKGDDEDPEGAEGDKPEAPKPGQS